MSEEEWFDRGETLLDKWRWQIDPDRPYVALSSTEEDAFEYAWELAGREMGIVE